MPSSDKTWLMFVVIAGIAWGTYVPIIFYGGQELTTKPGTIGGRLASILCVGIAYFFMAVVIPLVLMSVRDDAKPEWKMNGLIFSSLAGIMGAVGAICVIFASKAATEAAKAEGVNPAQYRMYIAPLIFSLAPAINTLMSLIWHPKPGNPWHFGFEMPGWKLPLGIVFVMIGTFLVLFSKEEVEASKAPPKKDAPLNPAPTPAPEAEPKS